MRLHGIERIVPQLPVYMDYQATTPLDPRVQRAMAPYWSERFGNPHSEGHCFGWEARRAVEQARGQVADLLGADDDEIVFVSGATESCNLAIRGVAAAAAGERRQIITVATEHPAVLQTVQALGRNGFDVEVLPVTGNGLLDVSILEAALSERTLLVSVMLVNNEIGVIQPIGEAAAACRSVGAILHTDATQAPNRMEIDVDAMGVDLLSISAHKAYGPNGIGALYIRKRSGLELSPMLAGGSQERGLRPGTLATPLVVGFGEACDIAAEEGADDARRTRCLTDGLREGLINEFPELRIFGDLEQRVPGSLCFGLPGVLAEQLVQSVSADVAISTGSACATGSPEPSHVLLSLGVGREVAASGVRVSMGRFTTQEDVEVAACSLRRALQSVSLPLAGECL